MKLKYGWKNNICIHFELIMNFVFQIHDNIPDQPEGATCGLQELGE